MYLIDSLLWILAWILLPVFNCANYFFVKPRFRYSFRMALAIDIFGNMHFAPMLNKLLIFPNGYKFGNQKETISEVLGRNIIKGTLKPFGKKVVKLLSPSHCLNAITVKTTYSPIHDTLNTSDMLELINQVREEKGLNKLIPEVNLNSLAESKAMEMNYFNKIDHEGFEKRFSISEATMMVENVGGGYYTEHTMFLAYMKSEGHKANILNKDATHIGISTLNNYNCCLIAHYN